LDLSQIGIENVPARQQSWKKLEKVWYSNHSALTGTPVDIPQMLALSTIGR
jgi:hypothetical protein